MPHIPPIKTRKYRKFLEQQGLYFERYRGDHEIWSKEGITRPVVFIANDKEVAPFYIRSNNKTLGITDLEFLQLIK